MPSLNSWFTHCAILIGLIVLPNEARLHADELAWKWEAGSRFTISYSQQFDQRTTVLLKPVTVETQTRMVMNWEVLSVDEQGNAKIRQQFTELELELKSSRGDTVRFDSRLDDAEVGKASPVGKVLTPLMQAPFEVTMSQRGEILAIEVPETSLVEIRQSASSMRLRQLFSKDSLRETLSFVAATLPEGEVSPGERWEVARDAGTSELPLKIKHQFVYERAAQADGSANEAAAAPNTADSDEGSSPAADQPALELLQDQATDAALARIGITTTVELSAPAEPREDGTKVASISQQSSQGAIWFDASAGHPVRSVQVQTLTTATPVREMTIEVLAETTTIVTIQKQ